MCQKFNPRKIQQTKIFSAHEKFILCHVDACVIRMSIDKYFKRLPSSQEKIMPSPHGSLSLSVPSRAVAAANKEVIRVLQQQQRLIMAKQQGRYNKYLPKERAEIGKYAVQHGVLSTRTVFSRKL